MAWTWPPLNVRDNHAPAVIGNARNFFAVDAADFALLAVMPA